MIFDDLLILTNNLVVDEMIDKIKYHNPKKILYYNACEFELNIGFDGLKDIENLLWGTNIEMFILLGGMNNGVFTERRVNNITYLFWPTIELSQTFDSFKTINKNIHDFRITPSFNKLYVNYTNNPKPHRCKLIDELCQENLFYDGINSWNKIVNNPIKHYDFICFDEKIIKVDNFTNDGITETGALINLVTESSTDYYVFSEKVWKPVLIEQPFIILGAQYQNQLLKKLGFVLYDEIFDYSFDNDPLLENRLKGIIENLKSIKNQNYNDIYEKIKPKLIENKQKAMMIISNIPDIPSHFVEIYHRYNLKDMLDIPINVTNILFQKPTNWGNSNLELY